MFKKFNRYLVKKHGFTRDVYNGRSATLIVHTLGGGSYEKTFDPIVNRHGRYISGYEFAKNCIRNDKFIDIDGVTLVNTANIVRYEIISKSKITKLYGPIEQNIYPTRFFFRSFWILSFVFFVLASLYCLNEFKIVGVEEHLKLFAGAGLFAGFVSIVINCLVFTKFDRNKTELKCDALEYFSDRIKWSPHWSLYDHGEEVGEILDKTEITV